MNFAGNSYNDVGPFGSLERIVTVINEAEYASNVLLTITQYTKEKLIISINSRSIQVTTLDDEILAELQIASDEAWQLLHKDMATLKRLGHEISIEYENNHEFES